MERFWNIVSGIGFLIAGLLCIIMWLRTGEGLDCALFAVGLAIVMFTAKGNLTILEPPKRHGHR